MASTFTWIDHPEAERRRMLDALEMFRERGTCDELGLASVRDAIVKLSVEGFKLAAGDPMPGGETLLHSSKFAVADRNGVIREYYGGTEVVKVNVRTVRGIGLPERVQRKLFHDNAKVWYPKLG